MKSPTVTRWTVVLLLASSLPLYGAHSKDDKKDKPKAQMVDSGSFGVMVKGQRVVTESFTIQQQNDISIIKSQLKEAGSPAVAQKSDLEITSTGELLRYEWNQFAESEPTPAQSLTVVPNNDFLLERITAAGSSKAAEQPYLMPSTSMILDNNFVVQREVLVWRYLAADCKSEGGNLKCQQGPVEFGVLVPQDRTSMRVRMELTGKEKVNIHGTERDLLRLDLSGENFQWTLWVDDHDQFKLMRVTIPADDTEVVRD